MSLDYENKFFLLDEIVKKNFSSKYKDSVLGILWSVLRPLLMMGILTIVFSTFFNQWIENYPVYLLSARCIFDFFVSATNVAMVSIKVNKNILQRTAAPKHIFVIGSVISEFINFIISFLILIVVMIVTKTPFNLTILFSIIPIFSVICMIIGIGLILSIFSVYYTDIQHLWSIITLIIMYTSAIFYPMDIIPEPYHHILILNPLFWVIDQFRDLMMYGIFPNGLYLFNSVVLSVIILVVGIIIFKKFENNVTKIL